MVPDDERLRERWSPWHAQPGDILLATDARGREHECIVVWGYEGTYDGHRHAHDLNPQPRRAQGGGKVHDFPVIWVKFTTAGEPLPWPVESVRPRPGRD